MSSLNLIKTILIEGNIGVGKSTIMSYIASKYPSNLVQVHCEPVENWMDIKGFDLLNALYTESNRWTFTFELTALLSRIRNHMNSRSNHHINIYERSILSCFNVFIDHDREQNYLNDVEYRILQNHYEYGLEKTIDLSSTAILYFDLPPKQCYERIVKRSRQSESSVDLERLEKLKHHYDKFIKNFNMCPVKVIDASQTLERTCEQIDTLLSEMITSNSDQ